MFSCGKCLRWRSGRLVGCGGVPCISNVFSRGSPMQICGVPRRLYGFSQFYVIIFLRFSKLRAGFGKCLRWLAGWLASWLAGWPALVGWLAKLAVRGTFWMGFHAPFRRKSVDYLAVWVAGCLAGWWRSVMCLYG